MRMIVLAVSALVFSVITGCNSADDFSDTESMVLQGIEWIESNKPSPQQMLEFAGEPLSKEDFGVNQDWFYILSMNSEDKVRGFVVSFKKDQFFRVKPITGNTLQREP